VPLSAGPDNVTFVSISDLIEGGIRDQMLARMAAMTAAGVQVVALLALSDDGAPGYDKDRCPRAAPG
jgi:VWA domain containing CoxE-like protein